MKTLLKPSLALALAAFVAWGTLTAAAEKRERTGFDSTVPAADPVYDEDGNPAVAGDTLLYGDASGLCDHLFPILARMATRSPSQSGTGLKEGPWPNASRKVRMAFSSCQG